MKQLVMVSAILMTVASCTKDPCKEGQFKCEANQSADWKVTAKIKKSLMGDGALSSHARLISVTTNQGVVTLSGNVATQEEGQRVVKMVKEIPGVSDIDNRLCVTTR